MTVIDQKAFFIFCNLLERGVELKRILRPGASMIMRYCSMRS